MGAAKVVRQHQPPCATEQTDPIRAIAEFYSGSGTWNHISMLWDRGNEERVMSSAEEFQEYADEHLGWAKTDGEPLAKLSSSASNARNALA
jgi:hypothetical protein